MSEYKEISDLEVLDLRKKNKEMEVLIQKYEALLKEHDLLDQITATSDEEQIAITQIAKMKELSDKGIPFTLEETKIYEVLVKTLLAIRGKAPVAEEKKKGKGKNHKVDIDNLLSIVGDKKHEV